MSGRGLRKLEFQEVQVQVYEGVRGVVVMLEVLVGSVVKWLGGHGGSCGIFWWTLLLGIWWQSLVTFFSDFLERETAGASL